MNKFTWGTFFLNEDFVSLLLWHINLGGLFNAKVLTTETVEGLFNP